MCAVCQVSQKRCAISILTTVWYFHDSFLRFDKSNFKNSFTDEFENEMQRIYPQIIMLLHWIVKLYIFLLTE